MVLNILLNLELDEWQEKCDEQLSPEQKAFLKGFHRAFQLREAAQTECDDPTLFQDCVFKNMTLF